MNAPAQAPVPTARRANVVGCTACGLVCRSPGAESVAECPRCGSALNPRKPDSLKRTWALLIASAIAYLPANLLPIMHTKTLLEDRHDTIVSGVVALWQAGSWDIAVIVFVASVVVPLVKIAILAMLLLTVRFGWSTGRRKRTQLYRMVDSIGHWSMLDIFVVVILVALVQFSTFAKVNAGPGAIAFGAVVVLTMFAAQTFDPRLIWDAAEGSTDDD